MASESVQTWLVSQLGWKRGTSDEVGLRVDILAVRVRVGTNAFFISIKASSHEKR